MRTLRLAPPVLGFGLLMLVVAGVLGTATLALGRILGGSNDATDCFAEFDGVTATFGSTLACTDGDPICDADGQKNGACTFRVRLCLDEADDPACTPDTLTSVDESPSFLPIPALPTSTTECGSFVDFFVPQSRDETTGMLQAGLLEIGVTATAANGMQDINTLGLCCVPVGGDAAPCSASTTTTSTTTSTT